VSGRQQGIIRRVGKRFVGYDSKAIPNIFGVSNRRPDEIFDQRTNECSAIEKREHCTAVGGGSGGSTRDDDIGCPLDVVSERIATRCSDVKTLMYRAEESGSACLTDRAF
jgi:hypothetical protein